MSSIQTDSKLLCPHCGQEEIVTMSHEACQFFRKCSHCKKIYRALPGDCCVFCSYGDVACPPIQKKKIAVSHK